MATGLPIIATGPTQGDAAKLLETSGTGDMINGNDQETIIQKLIQHFTAWSNGTTRLQSNGGKNYSRKEITRNLVDLL
jgi:hypothetical protein